MWIRLDVDELYDMIDNDIVHPNPFQDGVRI